LYILAYILYILVKGRNMRYIQEACQQVIWDYYVARQNLCHTWSNWFFVISIICLC